MEGNANNNANNKDCGSGPKKGLLQNLQYRFQASEEADHLELSQVKHMHIFRGFTQQTTSHGIPQIINARGPIKRSFWTIISLVMVGWLIFNLYHLIVSFRAFKVNVVIEMQHKRELVFPAVTLCNMNPIRMSSLHMVPQLEELLANQTYSNATNEGESIPGSIYPERVLARETFRMEEKVAAILADVNESTKWNIGHKAWELILDCQYSGYDCYWQEFSHFHNAIHGNCYTFNSNTSSVKMSFKTGRRYGLKLVLNIEQDEYVENLSEAAGVRVVVHPQDRMPFPQDEGIVVAPGILTSIGIRQITVSRKSYPHGNCSHQVEKNTTRNVFEQYFPVNYTDSACYKTCYQRYLINTCECGDPIIPMTGDAFGNKPDVKACNPDDIVQDDCKYMVSKEFNEGILDCSDCVLPCNEYSFEPEISTVAWPSDIQESSVLDKFRNPSAGISSTADDPYKYKRNLMKLEVYYEEFNYENINERPAYTTGQFASDIGGVLGLWIGWSIMTAFEFLEFGLDLAVLSCIKIFFRNKNTKTQPTNEKPHIEVQEARDQSRLAVTPRDIRPNLPPYYNQPTMSLKYV